MGAKGALAALDESGQILQVIKMPLNSLGEIDCFQVYSWLYENYDSYDDDVIIYTEKLHAIFKSSAASTFTFGKTIGKTLGVVECLEMPYVEVRAVDWQKYLFTKYEVVEIHKPLKKKQKKPSRDTKAMALVCAVKAFGAPVTPYIKHDGIIDALLIAKYAQETHT